MSAVLNKLHEIIKDLPEELSSIADDCRAERRAESRAAECRDTANR